MPITIEYTAQLKRAAGVASESVDVLPGTTIAELLAHAAARHGDSLRTLLLNGDGHPHPSVLIFRNDRQTTGDDSTPLQDAETITLLAPISGG
jgi:molybdopterin converting factor small subunit